MDPVPDPLLLRKSGSAGNRTRELCITWLKHSARSRDKPGLQMRHWGQIRRNRGLKNAMIGVIDIGKGKGKGHPCTGTEALYRPYGS